MSRARKPNSHAPGWRRRRAGELLDAVYAEIPNVGCKGLCQESCGSIAMTTAEQERIAARGTVLPQAAAFTGLCPALQDGRCTVYDVRPTVCRLWGAVESMKCEHGCTPADGRYLTDAEGHQLLARAGAIAKKHGPPPT